MQTRLHFSFKDLFRALRLGFSAKKIWMICLGLLFGLTGYSCVTYLAHWVAGNDLLTIWENYRLLPFPEPSFLPFPWFAWVLYAVGVLFLFVTMLFTGTAVTKVAYEQARGDEFFEARQAFRFAFRHAGSVLVSPLLLLGFLLVVVAGGLLLGLLGRIPQFGPALVGLAAFPAFIASVFIVYLLLVLLFTVLLGPAVVGTTRDDTFDTLFEVFSCVNEQPWRLIWYTAVVAALAKAGSFLLAVVTSVAGRIGYAVLRVPMGDRIAAVLHEGSFNFMVTLPDWWPAWLVKLLKLEAAAYGLPHIYKPLDLAGWRIDAAASGTAGWGYDAGAALVGLCIYVVALIVVAYGLSVWFTGNALSYAVMVHKKDDKNLLEIPEDEEELIEPVVPRPNDEPDKAPSS